MSQCPTCGAASVPNAVACAVCWTPLQPPPGALPPTSTGFAAVALPPSTESTPRMAYLGPGGGLFLVCLFTAALPLGAVVLVGVALANSLLWLANEQSWGDYAALALVPLALPVCAAILVNATHKVLAFYWQDATLDGRRCTYAGTPWRLFAAMAVPGVLLAVTFGLYGPWFLARFYRWVASQVDAEGESMACDAPGGGLFVPWVVTGLAVVLGVVPVLGQIAMVCALLWLHGRVAAWRWGHSTFAGRAMTFHHDYGDLLGAMAGPSVLSLCTGGIYAPWAICRLWAWEARQVR